MRLAPDYTIAQWRNDSQVDLESRRFFKSITCRAPYLADLSGTDVDRDQAFLSEFSCDGEGTRGLGYAWLLDSLAVSFYSEKRWDRSSLTIQRKYLNESANMLEDEEVVRHASLKNHIQEHIGWIKERSRPEVRDGSELWKNRQELFPHLEFCESTRKAIQNLHLNEHVYKQFRIRLEELENYSTQFGMDAFDANKLPCKTTLESESRLDEFQKQLSILCPDGKTRQFNWHVRMTPGPWRLYFYPLNGTGRMVIGYFGKNSEHDFFLRIYTKKHPTRDQHQLFPYGSSFE